MVVDDDAANARALADLLGEAADLGTEIAHSGAEALAALARRTPDALLLDVEMHGVSGLEVLATVRTRTTPLTLPVIMVTAHSAGQQIAAALAAGANDYVTKPVDMDVLLARLDTHLRLAELARLKDQLLGMASHDLKSPLTVVIMCAHALLDARLGDPVDQDLRDRAQAIARAASYMRRLVSDFLDLDAARDGRLRLELGPVALDALGADVAAEQRDDARDRGVTLCVTGDPTTIVGDSGRLTQVLHNLVGNALKYTPRGGRVEICTGSEPGRAHLEVRDDGPGLGDAPEQLFAAGALGPAQALRGERSTGLGLYIARLLVESHGGTIRAANREGGGAVFRIEIPLD